MNRFKIENFQAKQAFSSFLPGIAGLRGIPMWVFYVNRGQAVAGFGVESKDHPIMEFQPAQRAYQSVAQCGFRTFLKGQQKDAVWAYEPFGGQPGASIQRVMFTGLNEFEIEDVNAYLGLKTNVLYFLLPNEPFAALVRRVTFANLGTTALQLQLLDGLPVLETYGVNNEVLKNMGRTIEAWKEVINHESGLPFFRNKASADDHLRVEVFKTGNFAFTLHSGDLLPALVDPAAVFGSDTAFTFPRHGLTDTPARQVTEGRTPCAFFSGSLQLEPGAQSTLFGLYGHSASLETIKAELPRLKQSAYFDQKLAEARSMAQELTDAMRMESALPVFDAYCRQTFLDNVMRGGMPLTLGGRHTYHVFSRKHGDLERDYNFFVVAPEYYSQGNGNYRDVNQNRRSDVFFNPRAGEFNLRLFMSLMQSDGYNPLVIQGSTFSLPPERLAGVLQGIPNTEAIQTVLSTEFTPGTLLRAALQANPGTYPAALLENVFAAAEQHLHAAHGEGYWSDHWSYNLDLLQAHLAVFPEDVERLLWDADPLPFFDCSVRVNPRRMRFVLDSDQPRQFNVITEDAEKSALIAARPHDANWSRAGHGRGEVFRLSLGSKFALLALLKFAALDPSGFGVQMEGGKPGWYDALNGLPALFGSSMPDSYELLRLLDQLIATLEEIRRPVRLPIEAITLAQSIGAALAEGLPPFARWERLSDALETYREATRLGFDGACVDYPIDNLLRAMREALHDGLARAEALAGEVPPTYFIHHAVAYSPTGEMDGEGRPIIRVTEFAPQPLPAFLEGPVRRMSTLERPAASALYRALRGSPLYDQALSMFKVNAPLTDWGHEIGRARAFPPGWLENESIWMHMAFKLLLELLRKGLYTEFFTELKVHLPPFMDPIIYGRSILENSSFIASSAHPDPSLHGSGFVARLSGSTAEFINMWVLMTLGEHPFRVEDGALSFRVRPNLPGWLFKADGSLGYRLLNTCDVTLHNPAQTDTFDQPPHQVTFETATGEHISMDGETLPAPYAAMLREGKILKMDVYYSATPEKRGEA